MSLSLLSKALRKLHKTLQKEKKSSSITLAIASEAGAQSFTGAGGDGHSSVVNANKQERTIYLTKSREDINVNSLSSETSKVLVDLVFVASNLILRLVVLSFIIYWLTLLLSNDKLLNWVAS